MIQARDDKQQNKKTKEAAASAEDHGRLNINSNGGFAGSWSFCDGDKFIFLSFPLVSKFQQRVEVGSERLCVVLSLHG